MRISILFASIAIAVSGVAHADVVTFAPFDIPEISPVEISRASPNSTYLSGYSGDKLTTFRFNVETGQTDLFPWYRSYNINNAGTIAGYLFPEGGLPDAPNKMGAYIPLGSAPILITNPILENSAAHSISDDGTVVGLSTNNSATLGVASAYVWTAAGGMKKLPVNRPNKYSRANGISSDGHIIFGWNDEIYGFRTGVVWVDGVQRDIGISAALPYGEAGGISANDQFVVGNNAVDPANNNLAGGWRWNRADNSILYIPHMVLAFAVSNDGKTIVGNASRTDFVDPDYNLSTALIWREGVGTMRLTDWITANGGEIPPDWNNDIPGALLNLSSDATFMSGWASDSAGLSYTVKVTSDTLFADNFDGPLSPRVIATISPAAILPKNQQGAPATLTIALDNPGEVDATLTSDFVNEFPFGVVIADTPNASNTCSSTPLVAYPGYDYVGLLSGAVIPAGAHCVISVAVTSNKSGTHQNVIPAGSLQTDAGQNQTDTFSSVTVLDGGNGIVRSGPLNHAMMDTSSGSTVNWVAKTISDAGPGSGAWDMKMFHAAGGNLTFRMVATYFNGLAVDTGNNVLVKQPGDVIGPSTYFVYATGASNFVTPAEWLAGTTGYVGFRFKCDQPRQANQVAGGFCYGYMHLQTTAGTGYPVTLLDYAFDGDGKAITVGQ